MALSADWDMDSAHSDISDTSSISDHDDECNSRVFPDWNSYRCLITQRGFRLDTVRDVKEHYQQNIPPDQLDCDLLCGYGRACAIKDEDALCKDPGLNDNLFRGTARDGTKVVLKAVHMQSRELGVVRYLDSPPLRRNSLNRCIHVIEIEDDDIAFIVMEEWTSCFLLNPPCCLRQYWDFVEQVVEHVAFMHQHNIIHADISLHNVLADYHGNFAFIDYEISQRVEDSGPSTDICPRGTEVPPEKERGEKVDPFKADVWSLGVLLLRGSQHTRTNAPELSYLTRPMLHSNPANRPSAWMVLQEVRRLKAKINENPPIRCPKSH
ncbi:kinase-like protein [Coniophora puteana RWD-64-598 SS2]|uniref:Kinase-like protein n=1 Tax=Coniophora puteana (strain RWD-64-598) TaxID=741705 RepID=A0A5M3N2M1_CONPW|nr:kinase-like protein [Coniophora puteana RWD-64-598 SS2]EIW85161.1 kinase-like protein [Coniophora puteana RWD-64-598 SS2]